MNLKEYAMKQSKLISEQKELEAQRKIEEQSAQDYYLVWRIVNDTVTRFMTYSQFLETVKVESIGDGILTIDFPQAALIMIKVRRDGLFPRFSPLRPIDSRGNLFKVSSYEPYVGSISNQPLSWGWTFGKYNFDNFTEALGVAYEQWDKHLEIDG